MSQARIIERVILMTGFLAIATASSFPQHLQLVPHLHAGQILFYRIDFSASRTMKTESPVSSPQLPPSSTVTAAGLLQVEILSAGGDGLHLKTYYSERNAQTVDSSASDKIVEVSIASNGSALKIKGLGQLSPGQQFAWNDWLGRFTSSMTFPKGGVRAGQKWQTSEPETNSSPVAELFWTKKYQYVRDEPCQSDQHLEKTNPAASSPNAKGCAVILIQSALRQKSSPKNATPGDFRARNLKTRGSASGKNETILYVARSSGILVRSTEDAQQVMDVLVALTDDSNAVHYTLDANSHSGILLLPDSPQSPR